MTNQAGYSRKHREQEKADIYFLLYLQMGYDRSLSKLYEIVSMIGQKISEKTLRRYSAKYEWQRRVLEAAAKQQEIIESDAHQVVAKMNEQHAKMNQALLGLAVAGIKKQQGKIDKGVGTLDLSIKEIVGLARGGQFGERLARGQATSRVEVWLDIEQTVVREFGIIFLSVYQIEDRAAMKAEYIRLADEMLNRCFGDTARKYLPGEYNRG